MPAEQAYITVALTQGISTIVILLVTVLLALRPVYDPVPFTLRTWLLFIVIILLILVAFAFATPLWVLLGIEKPGFSLSLNNFIWILFGLDLVGLFYLVFNTGGLAKSPFSPFLVLLPINGIILEQTLFTVLGYCVMAILASLLLLRIQNNADVLDENVHQIAVGLIFSFVFLAPSGAYMIAVLRAE